MSGKQEYLAPVAYFQMTRDEEKELAALTAEVKTKGFAALPWLDRTRSEQRLKSLQAKAAAAPKKKAAPAVQQQQQVRNEDKGAGAFRPGRYALSDCGTALLRVSD
jgi:hypothetical protein